MELDMNEIKKNAIASYNRSINRLDKIRSIKTTAIRATVVVGAVGTLAIISHKLKHSTDTTN